MPEMTNEKAANAARMELQRAQLVMHRRPEDAIAHLSEAKRLDPLNEEIIISLARVEIGLERYSDALANLQRVIEMKEDNDEAQALAGLCHCRNGNWDEASDRAKKALGWNSFNPLAREVLADCLRAGGEWQGALKELNALAGIPGLPDKALARIDLKRAHCFLGMGECQQAWEVTGRLLNMGFGGRPLMELHKKSGAMHKAEIAAEFGEQGLGHRILMWLAPSQVLRAVSLGKKRSHGKGIKQ